MENRRYVDQQLLIRIADQLWFSLHPLLPSLLDHGGARSRRELIQGDNLVKLDLSIEVGLKSGRQVIGMVVPVSVRIMVMGMFVVAMVRHVQGVVMSGFGLWIVGDQGKLTVETILRGKNSFDHQDKWQNRST